MGDRQYHKGFNMKKSIPTVTIGIAAYNEEKNISKLLRDVCKQKEKAFVITQIVVALDGCTDHTKYEIERCNDNRIKVLDYKKNQGKIARTNNLLHFTKTDYLILIDADIKLFDDSAFMSLLEPMLKPGSKISLTSGRQVPIVGSSLVEKIASAGARVWDIAKSMSGYNSIYYCSGGNRAFAKSFYQKLKFPKIMAEDIYPYMYAKLNGYIFEYVPKPIILYSLPKTLKDYLLRDKRYTLSPLQHKQLFNPDLVNREFTINNKIRLKALFIAIFTNPIWTAVYLFLSPLPKLMAFFEKDKYQSTWKPLSSTRGGSN